MVRRLVGVVTLWTLCILACAGLAAAAVWEEKPFTAWSDKELAAITSDSPWAQKFNVVVQSLPRGGGDDEGGRGGPGGGRGGGAPGGGGGGGFGGGLVPAPQLKLLATWRSALPMKQAAVRQEVGLDGVVPAESQALLERSERFYVVTLTGLAAFFNRATGNLKAETVLKREGKAPIAPEDVLVQQVQNGLLLVFAFPKTDPITLEDKQVELFTKLGQIEIKKKFNLKSMVFHGKLEL